MSSISSFGDSLMQVIDGPQGDVLGLKVQKTGLQEHFDDHLEVAETFLGGRPDVFPMTDGDEWFITHPSSYRQKEKEWAFLDSQNRVLAADPALNCFEEDVDSIVGTLGCQGAHPRDQPKLAKAASEARRGSMITMDYTIQNGTFRRKETCTILPIDNPYDRGPFLLVDVNHNGYA